jgi:PAS domain-containing protein
MENEKRSFLTRINPGNLNYTNKILVLVLSIVIVILAVYFSIGLRTLHQSLLYSTGNQLEELAYTKAGEIETNLLHISDQISGVAGKELISSAGGEFINGFKALADDQYELFYGSRKNEVNTALEKYYSGTVAPNSPLTGDQILNFMPVQEKTIVSQYLYIAQNPKPFGEKYKFDGVNDFTAYSQAHVNHHRALVDLMLELNASDLYLADPKSGFVVYSTMKNIDFGTNLFDGKFRNTQLAMSFQDALASGRDVVHITDYSRFVPAGDRPVVFMSVPVYSYNVLQSVLILQFDEKWMEKILYDEDVIANISSLEYNLVGEDMIIRNNPKVFLTDPQRFTKQYLKKVRRNDRSEVLKISRTGNFALSLNYPLHYKKELLEGGVNTLTDYCGTEVVAASKILDIKGVDLHLISKLDRKEVLAPFRKQLRLYIILTTLLLIAIWLLISKVGRSYTLRISSLFEAMNLLHNGEKPKSLIEGYHDEVGTTIEIYNKLRKRIISAEEFALEMSEGNYNYEFKILSEKDSLGKSLNVLKDTLIQSKEEHEERAREDEIRNWINSGIAKFNDLLRQNNDNITILAYSIIENLIGYLNANIGGIFLVEGETEENKTIDLVASYAYDRKKYHQKSVTRDEGLLGACYMEKKPIFLKQIPEDYIEIVSGLGHEIPKCLYIMPLKIDENVLGMIEIASFEEFLPHQIEFINKVADSIAGTFVSVRLNMKTTTLLEESNRRAEEISQQEEEMRQNLEEMQATQEELARLRQDDEKRTREMQLIIENTRATMKNLLDTIPGGFNLKDQNGIIHIINREGAEFYGSTIDRIVGKTDHELLPTKVYEREHKYDLLTISEGEQNYNETAEASGEKVDYKVEKKPFMMAEIGQMGILTLRYALNKSTEV